MIVEIPNLKSLPFGMLFRARHCATLEAARKDTAVLYGYWCKLNHTLYYVRMS